MTLQVKESDRRYIGVCNVRVPGIYGRKGDPLPQRMAKLVRPAAAALRSAIEQVAAEGGHLYLSDMFRSAKEQQRAHEDWKTGRKTAYSPPACGSVHEAARAIDIDAFDTGIGHARVREILNQFGWVNIVETLTGAECWHYEFREERWELYKAEHGYAAMARAMKEEIGNLAGRDEGDQIISEVKWLQDSLNTILGTDLLVDGMYGAITREAVKQFQQRHGLQIDGVAGPITKGKIEEILAGL
jgi:peptidoglycan hydrolase-like protein with peptidoglycan-binding domain